MTRPMIGSAIGAPRATTLAVTTTPALTIASLRACWPSATSAGLSSRRDAFWRVDEVSPSGEVVRGGLLAPHWRASLEGTRFLDDADEPLPPGARVVILSGLSGG